MLYFAYGSNLDEDQMRERCPSAEALARAVLSDHALAFGGFSRRWGGAVASVVPAHGAQVHGLLYRIDDADLRVLDRFEGHPTVYERVLKPVRDERDLRRRAATYLLPRDRCAPGAPAPDYLNKLWRAYERLGFDVAPLARAAR